MVETCNENTRSPGDPECSSDEEIDKYLKGKVLNLATIESGINFKVYDKNKDKNL